MKLQHIITTGLLASAILFSGCASKALSGKPYNLSQDKTSGVDKELAKNGSDVMLIYGFTKGMNSISRAADAQKTALYMFQLAAERTLEAGDGYFAISRPKIISNTLGGTMHTVEEFKDRCYNNAGAQVASAFDAFGLGTYGCNIGFGDSPRSGFLEIVTYKERPSEVMTYDAKQVIESLKTSQEYVSAEDIKMLETSLNRGYGYWKDKKRDKE
jgi:predicted lipoprotein with Yx(FWY)xxD motif